MPHADNRSLGIMRGEALGGTTRINSMLYTRGEYCAYLGRDTLGLLRSIRWRVAAHGPEILRPVMSPPFPLMSTLLGSESALTPLQVRRGTTISGRPWEMMAGDTKTSSHTSSSLRRPTRYRVPSTEARRVCLVRLFSHRPRPQLSPVVYRRVGESAVPGVSIQGGSLVSVLSLQERRRSRFTFIRPPSSLSYFNIVLTGSRRMRDRSLNRAG